MVTALCGAQLANLLSHVAVPAVMAKHLVPLWHLSATEAGMMASAYTLGYFLSVPVLMSLTDRIDARLVLLSGSIVIAVANIAFGLLADGWVSATLLWGLAGIGGAATYMPGLRALTDRLDGGEPSRAISTYTASFSIAVGLSFLTSQLLADAFGWRRAFVIMGFAPIIAMIVTGLIGSVTPIGRARLLPDFRAVLRNRAAMGFILGYGAHCFELYGFRTWIVPFWTGIVARHGGESTLSPVAVSVLVSLIAFPASILGNEGALWLGRRRLIVGVMLGSALVAFSVAAMVTGPVSLLLALLLLYSVTLQGDSGALTSGMAMSASDADRGATMALHSMIGFGMAALGGTSIGLALDSTGGPAVDAAWSAAFVVLGSAILLGAAIVQASGSRQSA